MAKVDVLNVSVLNETGRLTDPIDLEILFTCFQDLPHDLEWKLVWVGSADSDKHDQELDAILMGATTGVSKFVLQTNGPNPALIPPDDILGMSALLLTCSYCAPNSAPLEIVRVGYYVSVMLEGYENYGELNNDSNNNNINNANGENNNGENGEQQQQQQPVLPPLPPPPYAPEKLIRKIIAGEPRVTRFVIDWEGGGGQAPVAVGGEGVGAGGLEARLGGGGGIFATGAVVENMEDQ